MTSKQRTGNGDTHADNPQRNTEAAPSVDAAVAAAVGVVDELVAPATDIDEAALAELAAVDGEEGDTGGKRKKPKTPKKNPTAKAWFIVLNNPRTFLVKWYRRHGQEPPEYILGMDQARLPILLAQILVPDDELDKVGVGINVEEGLKENTEHCHIVYYKPTGIRFTALQEMLCSHAFLQIQRGTKAQAKDYLEKKGKWADPKGDTLKVPPFYRGLALGDNRKRRGSDEIDELDSLIPEWVESGLSPAEVRTNVAAMGMAFAKYSQNAELVAQALIEKNARDSGRLGEQGEMMYVVWHFGEGGVGKTHSLRDLTRNRSLCYLIDPSMRKNPWDKYSFQPMVLWDDFRDTQIAYDAMLALLNREGKGTVTVDARYYPKTLAHCRMDITSINGPEKQWPIARQKREEAGQKEPLYQLTRRIDLVVYHFIDPRWPQTDSRHWCAAALPGGRRYKHGEQLERIAEEYLSNPYNGPKQQATLGFAVDSAYGATVKEKTKPKFIGTSDEVERQIRLEMWKKFEGDDARDVKLSFLGLAPEDTGEQPRETYLVADNSTVMSPNQVIPGMTMTVPASHRIADIDDVSVPSPDRDLQAAANLANHSAITATPSPAPVPEPSYAYASAANSQSAGLAAWDTTPTSSSDLFWGMVDGMRKDAPEPPETDSVPLDIYDDYASTYGDAGGLGGDDLSMFF